MFVEGFLTVMNSYLLGIFVATMLLMLIIQHIGHVIYVTLGKDGK